LQLNNKSYTDEKPAQRRSEVIYAPGNDIPHKEEAIMTAAQQ
jgi:hypothetical protein